MPEYQKYLEVINNGRVVNTFFVDKANLLADGSYNLDMYSFEALRGMIIGKETKLPPYSTFDRKTGVASIALTKKDILQSKLLYGIDLKKKVHRIQQLVATVNNSHLRHQVPIFGVTNLSKFGEELYLRGRIICSKKNIRILYAMLIYLNNNHLFKVLDTWAKNAEYDMLCEVVIPVSAMKALLEAKFPLIVDASSITDYDYKGFGETVISESDLKDMQSICSQYSRKVVTTLLTQ